jgi:hypothetical protein
MCAAQIPSGSEILEIVAGPSNAIIEALSDIGEVTRVDVDTDVLRKAFCAKTKVFDGLNPPFFRGSFDACVANWVLEHSELRICSTMRAWDLG